MRRENKKSFFSAFREFTSINSWMMWIAIAFMNYYLFTTMSYLKSDFSEALDVLKKESNGIVLLDKLGRPSVTKKVSMSINSLEFRQVILNNVQQYFISDWTSLSDGLQKKISTVEDLEKFNPKYKEFKENYIKKDDKKSQRQFLSFEKYIVYLINNDNLPETISVVKSSVTSYQTDGDVFSIKIVFNLISNAYNTEIGKYESRRGNISLEFSGLFDSVHGSIANPLGLIYTDLKPSILTKRDE